MAEDKPRYFKREDGTIAEFSDGEFKDFTTRDIKLNLPEDYMERIDSIIKRNNAKEFNLKRGIFAVALAGAVAIGAGTAGYVAGQHSAYTAEDYLSDYSASDRIEKEYLDRIREDRSKISAWENDKTVENRVQAVSAARNMRDTTLQFLAFELGVKRVSYKYDDKLFKVVIFDYDGNEYDYKTSQVPDEIADLVGACESIDFYNGTGENGNWEKAMSGFVDLADDIFEITAKTSGRQLSYLVDSKGISTIDFQASL